MKYDYFIAGRTRNRREIQRILDEVRDAGKSAYCFIENAYESDEISFDPTSHDAEAEMKAFEQIEDWRHNPTLKKIYEDDMNALRNSKEFIVVLPAGLSAHMELGAAYGMGKKCFAIGEPEKVESLYFMINEIYHNANELLASQRAATV